MADSNRTRLAIVRESTQGTLPASPRMRIAAMTGEQLSSSPNYFTPNTIRSDRMNIAPSPINDQNGGQVGFEFTYPPDKSYLSEWIASAMWSDWVNMPIRDNDGTADSVITDIGTTTDTIVCTTGATFVVGHLVLNSGFALTANNGLFPVTTGGATSLVSTSSSWVAETAPPAAARVEVVGFQGGSGVISATANGLASATALDFTTLGLAVGQWIEIGGTGTAFHFATAACRGYARITVIAAHALTCDNLPTGWTTDAGSGKTIRVFVSGYIRNGTTWISHSMERGYLDQTVPSYILQKGMTVNTMAITINSGDAITGTVDFMGMSNSVGTSANGSTYAAAPTERVYTANISVGRISENGAAVVSPNFVRNFTVNINNNLREDTAVGTRGAIRIGGGDNLITGQFNTYYGDTTLLTKVANGTLTNASAKMSAANSTGNGSRAVIITVPVVTFTSGNPNATAKNVSIELQTSFQGSIDSVTNSQLQIDRFAYVEES